MKFNVHFNPYLFDTPIYFTTLEVEGLNDNKLSKNLIFIPSNSYTTDIYALASSEIYECYVEQIIDTLHYNMCSFAVDKASCPMLQLDISNHT